LQMSNLIPAEAHFRKDLPPGYFAFTITIMLEGHGLYQLRYPNRTTRALRRKKSNKGLNWGFRDRQPSQIEHTYSIIFSSSISLTNCNLSVVAISCRLLDMPLQWPVHAKATFLAPLRVDAHILELKKLSSLPHIN
jgi:hypothetical protein